MGGGWVSKLVGGGGVDVACTSSSTGNVGWEIVLDGSAVLGGGLRRCLVAVAAAACGMLGSLFALDDLPVFLFEPAELEGEPAVIGEISKPAMASGGDAIWWGGEGRIAGTRTRTRHVARSAAASEVDLLALSSVSASDVASLLHDSFLYSSAGVPRGRTEVAGASATRGGHPDTSICELASSCGAVVVWAGMTKDGVAGG